MRYGVFLWVLATTGCSWFGAGEAKRQLEEGSSPILIIPEGLDNPKYVDLMPIPQVADRGLGELPADVNLPQALSTSFGVEKIIIRRLGDSRWVFLDLPTATIWPQVVLYWEDNHLPVAQLEPRNGVLETEWLFGSGNTADEIFDSLISGSAWEEQLTASQYRFRVRVEPGVRTGSSELYAEVRKMRIGAPYRLDRVEWTGVSDDFDLEAKLLTSMAHYLGERVASGPTVSLLATGLQESKAKLVPEPSGMVLKYKLGFDRAWATVGAALENARVSVEDLDRSSANYYVYYTLQHNPKPSFFGRLFSGDDNGDESEGGHRFQIHLKPDGEEVHVTVAVDNTVAEADPESLILSERLLKLIKEYST